MKVSEVTTEIINNYLRSDETELSIDVFLQAAKSFIKGYTGLTDELIDTHEDITVALLVLISDMYDNRQYTVNNDKVNVVAKSILNMYCTNLL